MRSARRDGLRLRHLSSDAQGIADCRPVPKACDTRRFEVPLDNDPRIVAIDAACMELDAFRKVHSDAVKPA